jgi:hypothetical protein
MNEGIAPHTSRSYEIVDQSTVILFSAATFRTIAVSNHTNTWPWFGTDPDAFRAVVT